MPEAGIPVIRIARRFDGQTRTIRRLRDRFNETERFEDRPRSGRAQVTTRRQDRHIRIIHFRDRFYPAPQTTTLQEGTHGCPISAATVRRCLREADLSCRRPFQGQILSCLNRTHRLRWAQKHLRWNFQRWGGVAFSDESHGIIGMNLLAELWSGARLTVIILLRCFRKNGKQFPRI